MVVLIPAACGTTSTTAAEKPATQSALLSTMGSPPGPELARTVDGVPLIPTSRSQRSQCQKIANATHAAVPCPGLIPDPIPSSGSHSNCADGGIQPTCGSPQIAPIEDTSPYFFWNQMSFQVPPDYVGVPGQTTIDGEALGHFVIYAGKNLNLSRTKTASPIPVYCTQTRRLRVHGVTARMYVCANSSNGKSVELDVGHELLVWKQSGVICEVSLHGHSQINQDLDLVIANASRIVAPAK
jgi:hypothetical protein